MCYAYGIHLAVCAVLYKKTDTLIEIESSTNEPGEPAELELEQEEIEEFKTAMI